MVYKDFRLQCILRVFALVLSIFLFFYLYTQTEFRETLIILAVIIVTQMIGLIKTVDRTNRELTRFLESIHYSDFSQSFTTRLKGAGFKELNAAFQKVFDKFKAERQTREEQTRFLQTIVQHIGVGLLAFKHTGQVELINNATKRMLNKPRLRTIQQLKDQYPDLEHTLMTIRAGEKNIVRMQSDINTQLVIYATKFIKSGKEYTLVSLQDIQAELENKEMEAWQKLIRVLTHEIMNSITPIHSLAGTASALLNGETESDKSKDLQDALDTIQRRSKGLIHFVENYRKLSRIPQPNFQIIDVGQLFNRIKLYYQQKAEQKSIQLEIKIIPEQLNLTADPDLVEQALINLVKNAIEAVKNQKNPVIRLLAFSDDHSRINIQVEDNGVGIKPEMYEKIFIPFFTTKPQGTGIGLSLARQIMHLHRGSIHVNSQIDVGTVFTLKF